MFRKLFCVLMILIALALAILTIVLPQDALRTILIITNFFEIMIPILAVAALINYIWKSNCCCCCSTKKED